jgi:hypothetical protein
LLALLSGCTESRLILPPPLGPAVQSVLFSVQQGEHLSLLALDANAEASETSIRGDAELFVLLYRASLAELHLSSGPVLPADPSQSSTLIPRPDDIVRGEIQRSSFGGWQPTSTLSEALSKFRLPIPDPETCLDMGGCSLSPPGAGMFSCTLPCPAPSPVAPPVPPAGPNFTPCPPGWTQTTSNDSDQLVYCEPWPLSGKPTCDRVSMILPGDAACLPIGDPCPTSGDYAPGLPASSPILYVKTGAPAGGNGSVGAPFSTVGAAMAQATPGTIVALARGRYAEPVFLADGVTLWGACVGGSTIAGTITIGGGTHQSAIKDLSVSQSPDDAILNKEPGAKVTLDGVILDGAGLRGMTSLSATISGRNVLIRGSGSNALGVGSGGSIILSRADISSSPQPLVLAFGGELILSDSAIHDITGTSAVGLFARSGATVRAARTAIERVGGPAVDVSDPGTRLEVEDVVVRDTVAGPGEGLWATMGATLVGSRILVERTQSRGLNAEQGASVDLSDVAVRYTLGRPPARNGGLGATVGSTSTMALERALLSHNRDTGIYVNGFGALGTFTDLTLQDTASEESSKMSGYGLACAGGGAVHLVRTRLVRNRTAGLSVLNRTSALVGSDLVVSDTLPQEADGMLGRGLDVDNASVSITRAEIERNRGVAARISGAFASASLRDVLLTDTTPSDQCPTDVCNIGPAVGFAADPAARVGITRFVIARNPTGLYAVPAANLVLDDGTITSNSIGVSAVGKIDFAPLAVRVLFENNGANFSVSGP